MHKKFSIYIALFFFISTVKILTTAANAETKCSVIIEGVKDGKVDLDFYNSICGGGISKPERLRDALRIADGKVLKDFSEPGEILVRATFQQPELAKTFFRFAKSPEALDWFNTHLSSTISPNLVLDGKSLLELALQESNISIARLLLEAGATPHIYDELWGGENYFPKMLFPLTWLHKLDIVSSPRDARGFMHFYAKHVLVPDSEGIKAKGQTKVVEQRISKIEELYRIKIDRSLSICGPRVKKKCEKFSKEENTCTGLNYFPQKLISHKSRWLNHNEFKDIDLIGLLGVYNGRLYIMTRNSYQNFGLLVSNPSFTRVTLFGRENALASSFCRGPDGLKKKRYRYNTCWRKIVLDQTSQTQMEVRGSDDIKFQKYFCK